MRVVIGRGGRQQPRPIGHRYPRAVLRDLSGDIQLALMAAALAPDDQPEVSGERVAQGVIGGISATVLGSANRLAATKPFQLARLSARRRHRWHENSCTAPNRKKRASLALGYRLRQSRPGSQRRRSFRPFSKFWRAWSRHLAPAGPETLYRVNALAGSDRLAEPAAP
jgi:hypothetical protein